MIRIQIPNEIENDKEERGKKKAAEKIFDSDDNNNYSTRTALELRPNQMECAAPTKYIHHVCMSICVYDIDCMIRWEQKRSA